MTKQELITNQLQFERDRIAAELELLNKFEAIMQRMPEKAIAGVRLVCGMMVIYEVDRDTARETMKALNAGRWTKTLGSAGTVIHYFASVDGVDIQFFNIPPPDNCKIETEEVYIPAHNEIVRKLVCA